MILVLKFGGSLLYENNLQFNREVIDQWIQLVRKLYLEHQICVVVGGGKITRMLSHRLNDLNNAELDILATKMTWVHAYIVSRYLARYLPTKVITNHEELLTHFDGVHVTGGFYPGQSTNGAAATCAEILNADLLVNYFNYDKVYSSDPEKGGDGKPLDKLDYLTMRELIGSFSQSPGHYELFDYNALNTVERSNIPVLFLNGKNPHLLLKFLKDERVGTLMEGKL